MFGDGTLFYDRFIALCAQKGISASFVVQQIGLNKSSATYWKNGSIPKGDTLQKLADYFGVSVDYLIGTSEEKWSVTAARPKDSFFNWLARLGFLTAKHTQEGIDEYFIIDSETSNIFPVSLKQLKELERESASFTKFQITEFLKAIKFTQTAPESTPAPPKDKNTPPGGTPTEDPPEDR